MRDREKLIQEDWINTSNGPWKILVVCQCLNRANWMVAEGVVQQIFDRWPRPEDCSPLNKTYLGHQEWLNDAFAILRPLGFGHTRTYRLADMSLAYLRCETDFDYPEEYPIREFPGCGAYAEDAWNLFVLKVPRQPNDRLLRKYAERTGLYLEEYHDLSEAVA